jgi:hypothetical protein
MKLRQLLFLPPLGISLTTAVAKPATANPALAACAGIQDPIRHFYCEGSILSGQASQARSRPANAKNLALP